AFVDEPPPAPPGDAVQLAGVEERPEGRRGYEQRGADRAERTGARDRHEPLAGEARSALLDDLLDLVLRVLRLLRVRFGDLLRDDESARDHGAGECEQ